MFSSSLSLYIYILRLCCIRRLMATIYRKVGKYLLTGATACSGALIFYYGFYDNSKKKVFASWTTNYVPTGPRWDSNWDHREPASLLKHNKRGELIDENDKQYKEAIAKVSCKATRHIFLIRHGQYNLEGSTDGERILTKLGRSQAEFTGERLKQLDFPYTSLVKSTMKRAQETGEIIEDILQNKKIEIFNCNLLEEGAPVPPDPPVGHWRPENAFYEDGPRIEAAFRKYIHRAEPNQATDSYEIIVCHANVIRYFVCRALQFPAEAWLRFTLHHCSITWLMITPGGRVIVRGLGDSGHIPPHAVTSS